MRILSYLYNQPDYNHINIAINITNLTVAYYYYYLLLTIIITIGTNIIILIGTSIIAIIITIVMNQY